MNLLLPFRMVYCIYATVLFVILMICVTPFVLAGSFFGKIRGGNFIYEVCGVWADVWYFLIGIRHRNIYEEKHDRSHQYIFVANHISYLDAPEIVKSIKQPVRVLGKVEYSNIPIFGYIYRNAIVTVDRSSPGNRANSVRVLKSVLRRGISIFIFPEGTFNETHQPLKEFYNGAFRIAIETQTPIKPILFLHAYDRMNYESVLSLNPGKSVTVFLKEVPVKGLTMRDLPMLKQQVYDIMEEKLLHYRAKWIKHPEKVKSS